MFPWTHAAFGYLCFIAVAFLLGHRASKAELLAVLVGTQLADAVDKPLAWWFDAVPSGRSLAHSLVVVVPLLLAVLAGAWYRDHPEAGLAFGFGYLTHLLGDTYAALYYWRTEELTFLLWPFLPAYPYDDFTGFGDFAGRVELTTPLVLLFVGSAAVGVVFLVHFARAPRWHTPRSG